MDLRHISEWPNPFLIPKFSYDVELKLSKANVTYEKSKKGIAVTGDMKMEILDKIAEAVFEIKSYPEKDELESVVSALVLKYPCLKEPGSFTGYEGWKASIKRKLGNYRSKLRQAGCNEVHVNRKRKGVDEEGCLFTLKKPKRGEVNHVPDFPQHHDDSTLEQERVALVGEMNKQKNMTVIQQKMALTFSLRRRKVVECQPMVSEVQERWPALFSCEEISEEFHRITSKDLLGIFNATLDKFVPGLLKLDRSKKVTLGEKMEDLLDKLYEQTSNIVSHRKTAPLRGLPIFLREDATGFPEVPGQPGSGPRGWAQVEPQLEPEEEGRSRDSVLRSNQEAVRPKRKKRKQTCASKRKKKQLCPLRFFHSSPIISPSLSLSWERPGRGPGLDAICCIM
ncbi:uncharacterized protein LOC133465436 [Phyllopteryx taeniolatus]|uniref:uncharacterized protein LOC133465436 n=1 Tax=Phyllopteryx taeniolatus TaxID=161469 RepID=UPI002AD3080A|nr:uncharacterized protein LOC133465436 [Phyllopteryx taeniolatus]